MVEKAGKDPASAEKTEKNGFRYGFQQPISPKHGPDGRLFERRRGISPCPAILGHVPSSVQIVEVVLIIADRTDDRIQSLITSVSTTILPKPAAGSGSSITSGESENKPFVTLTTVPWDRLAKKPA